MNPICEAYFQHLARARPLGEYSLSSEDLARERQLSRRPFVSLCKSVGIRSEEVYYFNDYEALYERFRQDTNRKTFAEAEHGGFAVQDFSVLRHGFFSRQTSDSKWRYHFSVRSL